MIAKSVSGVKRTAPSVGLSQQTSIKVSAQAYRGLWSERWQTYKVWIVLVASLVVLSGAHIWIKSTVTSISYQQINHLQSELRNLTNENNELELKVSRLKSPTRIRQVAETQLGMVLPNDFLYKSDGTRVERNTPVTGRIVD